MENNKRIDIRNLYVIYDKLAGEVASPIISSINDETAKRAFSGYISGNPQYPCKDDYDLICVGQINMATAEIVPADEFIMNGSAIPSQDVK